MVTALQGICRGFHADLVSIESNDENLLIEGHLQNKHPHGMMTEKYLHLSIITSMRYIRLI